MIKYVTGDAMSPMGKGNKIIAHICNDIGAWGKGFVLAVDRKYKLPKKFYQDEIKNNKIGLGDIQIMWVDGTDQEKVFVVNMIAQHDIRYDEKGNPPIRYDALKKCLSKVKKEAMKCNASIHMPRIGAGLAGGDWEIIEKIINDKLEEIEVSVYDLPKKEGKF